MSSSLRLLLLSALLLISLPSGAEGGTCPPGMYPVRSPGVLGCAPFPQSPAAEPAIPESPWADRWGAVAADVANTNTWGLAEGKRSQRAAESQALKICRGKGGQGCTVFSSFANSCAFVAFPFVDGNFVAGYPVIATGAGQAAASDLAQSDCEKKNGMSCKVEFTTCSMPVRRSF